MRTISCQALAMIAATFFVPTVSAQRERIITAEELSKFKPESVARIQADTAATRLSPETTRRLRDMAVDRSAVDRSAVDRSAVADVDAARVAEVMPRPPDIRITPDQYVVLSSVEPARKFSCAQAGTGDCIETQVRFLAMTPQGEPLDLSLVLASTERLRFDNASNRFVGSVFVQLRDENAPDDVKDIGSAIRVAVNADVDDIQPASMVEIVQTNRFRDVTLASRSPQDPTLVRLTPERSADPQELTFGVARPSLQVRLGADVILGYGLETTTVTVQAEGVESVPTNAISVSTERGRLDDSDVQIDGTTRIARTLVRSRGTGADTVTASLSPFAPGSDSITYEPPWSWLIAVVLGVVVGIGIRLAMRARQAPPKTGLGFNIAIGAIGGLITAVLYALGVNILPLPLPGGFSEGLTFLLSALGGWVFPRWLEALGPAKAAG